ncbi:hypothetical protein J5N97_000741 [Dioscorea zingiberensis]|uniref:Dihydroxy-acid/6-phosphogluconate dehydratase N-terminal domain-containing protein n=1 Tax=Dioscorea zingiberensis TaxID=325984 RepID=A0A9D5BVC4_9LILI|nr:hypothetical protein J5N97_000741 [Dioscorea zingiberensis]
MGILLLRVLLPKLLAKKNYISLEDHMDMFLVIYALKHSSMCRSSASSVCSDDFLPKLGEDMKKPQVGISSMWYEYNTCNMHLMRYAEAVHEGVRDAGMVGFWFNTIGVNDAISMGTIGMCYSLQSRDLIADNVETVMAPQWYDNNVISDRRIMEMTSKLYHGHITPFAALHTHRKLGVIAELEKQHQSPLLDFTGIGWQNLEPSRHEWGESSLQCERSRGRG